MESNRRNATEAKALGKVRRSGIYARMGESLRCHELLFLRSSGNVWLRDAMHDVLDIIQESAYDCSATYCSTHPAQSLRPNYTQLALNFGNGRRKLVRTLFVLNLLGDPVLRVLLSDAFTSSNGQAMVSGSVKLSSPPDPLPSLVTVQHAAVITRRTSPGLSVVDYTS